MRFKRFGLITFILSLCFSLPLAAEEKGGWVFDSLATAPNTTTPDAQQVYQVLLKMLDRWNAHDIEGHLEVYWKSPELLVVVDSEQFNGWQQLHDSYMNRISHSPLPGGRPLSQVPSRRWWETAP